MNIWGLNLFLAGVTQVREKRGEKSLSLTSINERFRFSAEGDLLLYLFLLPASNNFKPFHWSLGYGSIILKWRALKSPTFWLWIKIPSQTFLLILVQGFYLFRTFLKITSWKNKSESVTKAIRILRPTVNIHLMAQTASSALVSRSWISLEQRCCRLMSCSDFQIIYLQ